MKVTLALDLGTNTGFALLRADGRIESGPSGSRRAPRKARACASCTSRRWLVEVKQANGQLAHVAYEKVMGHGPGVQAGHIYGGFLAVLMMFCEHHQLTYEGFHVGTIKKRWTGNGAAKKPEMMARCQALGFAPANDNEADAIALLHLACDACPSCRSRSSSRSARSRRTPIPRRARSPSIHSEDKAMTRLQRQLKAEIGRVRRDLETLRAFVGMPKTARGRRALDARYRKHSKAAAASMRRFKALMKPTHWSDV
jgi:hypothetical protein